MKTIYSICFSCTEDGRAYIGGIQGGKDIANDEIKVLTKELHGTDWKILIISLLYGFLQHSDIKDIYAIDSDFHVKSEKVQPVGRLRCGRKSKKIVAGGGNTRFPQIKAWKRNRAATS